MKHILRLVALLATGLFISQNSFAHFGSKGPLGGTVTAFHVLKKKNGTADSVIFAGTANGGVYQSTNGTSWSARPVGLKSGKITALVHTGAYLFAATADSGIFRFTGFVGSDRYWVKVNTGLTNLNVTSLIAIDSITVWAGTNGGGVFASTNKGGSWTAINNHGLHHYEIEGFAKKGNRIYTIAEGVWGTDNFGASWFDANDIYTEHVEATNAISYNSVSNQLLVSNKDGLFAATVGTDTTLSFTLVDTGLPSGYEINSISNDGNAWYLATNQGVFISDANSLAWIAANTGLKTLKVNAVTLFTTKLVAGTSKVGIYSAGLPISSWSLSNTGFNNIETYSLVTSDSISVVANEYGIFVSKDIISGTIKPYVKSNNGLKDSLNVTDVIFADFCLLATTKNEGVFFSPDTAQNWIQINAGLLNLHLIKAYYANGKKYVIDINGNVYESDLHGAAWAVISSTLPSGTLPTSLTFFSNKILLTSKNNGVFVKSLSGTNWTAVSNGLTNLHVTASTTQHNKLFIGTHGDGVFLSDTATISWTATATKPQGTHTVTVQNEFYPNFILSMLSFEGYVYAAYRGGIYATADNGANWIQGGNQFNFPTFSAIHKISMAKGRVFVTTENNSVYSNALSELPALISLSSVIKTADAHDTLKVPVDIAISSVIPVTKVEIYDGANIVATITDGNMVYSLNNPSVGKHSLKAKVTFVNGLTSTSALLDITINTPVTSIEDQSSAAIYSVYPNPNHGSFSLNLGNEPATVTVTDLTGFTVATFENVTHGKNLTLNASSGIYIVKVSTLSKVSTSKIVVE